MFSLVYLMHTYIPLSYGLKGNSHQILLSEVSLPGTELLIEKLPLYSASAL